MMTCPPEIAEVLTEILRVAILRIRARGWEQNAAACAVEADHVHNVPSLLANYSDDAMRYYLDYERVSFAKKAVAFGGFEELWQRLDSILAQQPATRG